MCYNGLLIHPCGYTNDWDVKQQTRLPALLAEHNTKLVALDSVAAVFRLESTSSVKVLAASVSIL